MTARRSGWSRIGMGCVVLLVVGSLATVVAAVWLYRSARRFETEMRDPETRAARVSAMLGVEQLPERYFAVVAISVPFTMQLSILSDSPPDSDGRVTRLGEWGLVYVETLGLDRDEREWIDFFEGAALEPRALRDHDIHVEAVETLARGEIDAGEGSWSYVTQRGTLSAHGYSQDGIAAIVRIDCPADSRTRLVLWYGPDRAPGRPAQSDDLEGTPADEHELRRFLGQFRLCDGSRDPPA